MKNKIVRPERKKPPKRVANKRTRRRGKGGIPESIQKAIVSAVFGFLL